MVNEQIGSGFRKAWFLVSKGFVCKAVYYPMSRCPRYLWVWVSTGNFLLQLLPKPWGAQSVPAGGSARHGQLSHCWPLTWVSPSTCTGQCRACSGDSSWKCHGRALGNTDTHRSEGGKTKQGWDCLFPLDATDVWAAVLLGKEPALGKSGFVFSHVNRLSHLSPAPCRSASSHSQWLPSDQLLALPLIRHQFLLLAKSRVATCQEPKIVRGSQLSERERNSKTRSAIINRQLKLS